MSRLEELRLAAEKATPGPWGCDEIFLPRESASFTTIHIEQEGWDLAELTERRPELGEDNRWNDASFIAQANPETVLALIALVEELSAALVRTSIFTPVGRVETRRLARAALASAATWMEE